MWTGNINTGREKYKVRNMKGAIIIIMFGIIVFLISSFFIFFAFDKR